MTTTKPLIKSSLLGLALILSGCGSDGSDGSNGVDGLPALVSTTSEAAGANCIDGGMRVDVGLDDNINGILDITEIDSTEYVCNGEDGPTGETGETGETGVDGLTTLITTSTEAAGVNCANGGIRINVGLDDDADGVLQSGEIDSTEYVCNGADGLTGADGLSALVTTTAEAAGANCTEGGVRIDVGLDDDANGVLAITEIDSTSYVCNGADGLDGATGTDGIIGADGLTTLITTTAEAAGTNCTEGGIRIDVGLDDDNNGTLEISEIDNTEYVCNGADGLAGGLVALVTTTPEAAGANCTDGGIRIDVGLDDDANGTLEASEIDSTSYVCNGADGLDGATGTTGAAGTDGLTTLINTSTEAAGTNCTEGGIRIDVGLDDDDNGTLDPLEVDSTEYVCNGADGLTGADGTDGATALINTTPEAAGANCTNGGVRIDIGLDDDANGTLDAIEIDTTEYVCNGEDGLNTGTGTDGLTALIVTSPEAAGANCTNGGVRIDVGLDDDRNGTLEIAEIDSTSYVCNGADGLDGATGTDGVAGTDGLTTLINTTTEPAGMACTDGGIRIDVGLDDDNNGTLESIEIDNTSYVCNGADGLTGTDGTDGFTALIATTVEPEGANCEAGGIKVDVGLDDNINGILDAIEIDSTEYVCNGVSAPVEITGTLDSTFGTDGIVVHHNAAGGDGSDEGYGIVLDASDNVYVTGVSRSSAGNNDMVIWKYDSTGTLDSTFGTGGIVVHDGAAGQTNSGDTGYGIALDGSGNVYVTGESTNSAGNGDMAIWKYDSSGTLDGTFGTGGIVVHNGAAGDTYSQDSGWDIVLDNSGNVYVTGLSDNSAGHEDMVIWKYDSSGTLDGTFGTGGIVVSDGVAGGTSSRDGGFGIVLDNSGNVYATGQSANSAGNYDMVIWKYDSSGTLDGTFGTGGIVVSDGAAGGADDFGFGIVLDGSGNVYVTGDSTNSAGNYDMVIWKYDNSGTLDGTFGTGGIVVHDGAAGLTNSNDDGWRIVLDGSGNIYVTGDSTNSTGNSDMVIWKYDNSGTLDSTFGTGGIVVSDGAAGGTNGTDFGYGIVLDGSGNVYVSGWSVNSAGNTDMVIWKYK